MPSFTPENIGDTIDPTVAELVEAEKRAASFVPIGQWRIVLIGCAAVFIVSLLLPHAGSVSGVDVLLMNDNAARHDTNITETVNGWIGLVASLLAVIVAITARRQIAQVATLACFVATVFSMIAMWMRQVRSPEDNGSPPAIGLYIDIACMTVMTVTLILLVIQRNSRQIELDQQRRSTAPVTPLALAQAEAQAAKLSGVEDPMEDNRRAQARARIARTKKATAATTAGEVTPPTATPRRTAGPGHGSNNDHEDT